jgi:hypothetical protein
MGQMVVGILYGVEAPEVPARGDEDPDEGAGNLVYRWEKAKKITWDKPGPKVRFEREGGVDLLGVWVAVGGSGEDGAPHFLDEAVPLASAADLFRERIARAEKLWARFAAWAEKNEGLSLPLPKLWLTPTETA